MDHVDEQLDTHWDRAQTRRFLKHSFHKMDRHISYGAHVLANEYHSNKRMQHNLNATKRRKHSETEQKQQPELAMGVKGGASSRPNSRAALRRNMRANGKNGTSVWYDSETSLSSSSEDDGDGDSDDGNTANTDQKIDLGSVEAAIIYDIGVGVGGGLFGADTVRRKQKQAGQRMMLRSRRGRRDSTTRTSSSQSLNKVAQVYSRSVENDAEQKKSLIKKKHFLRDKERAAFAALKTRASQAREKRMFFGEFRMRDVYRQKLNKTPLRRRSKTKQILRQSLRTNAVNPHRATTTIESHGAVPFVERKSKTATVLPLGIEPRPARPPSQLRAPLYRPKDEYAKSLDPDSHLYSPTKGERYQRQLLIDIYLDTCNELGITPEPLIVSACTKQDQLIDTDASLHGSGARAAPIKIDTLDLSSKSLGNKAVIALCTALSHSACNVHYRLISLKGNRLTDVGAQAISTLLGTHDTVEELLLGNNRLHTVSHFSNVLYGALDRFVFSPKDASLPNPARTMYYNTTHVQAGARIFGRTLQNPGSRLTHIGLSENKIGREGIEALCVGLKKNETLTTLDLKRNGISFAAGALLADMLAHNTSLLWIDLSWNGLAGQGSVPIFKCLGKGIPESPDLGSSSDDGFHLRRNTTLRSINLSWCGLGNKSLAIAKSVVDCLHVNSSLTDIALSHNQLSEPACVSIVGALANHTSMRALHLNGNDPSPMLSFQAVEQCSELGPGDHLPSHRLPCRSLQRALKRCALVRPSQSKLTAENSNVKRRIGKTPRRPSSSPSSSSKTAPSPRAKRLEMSRVGKKGTKGKNQTKKKKLKKQKDVKSGMLGKVYLGNTDDASDPKDVWEFLRDMKTELGHPPGFSWIFTKFAGCSGVRDSDDWMERRHCWICEGWQPHTFHYAPGLSGISGLSISVLLSCREWQSTPMTSEVLEMTQNIKEGGGKVKAKGRGRRMSYISPAKATLMVPPGKIEYTFMVTTASESNASVLVPREVYALDQPTKPSHHTRQNIASRRGERRGMSSTTLVNSSKKMTRSWSGSSQSSLGGWSDSSLSSSSASSVDSISSSSGSGSDSDDSEDADSEQIALVNHIDIPKRISLIPEDSRVDNEEELERLRRLRASRSRNDDDSEESLRDANGNIIWSRRRSIFKTFRQESVMSLTSEFSVHWNLVRARRLVRDHNDMEAVRSVMMERFYEVRELFRYYSAAGGHAFGVSSMGFVACMREAKLIDSAPSRETGAAVDSHKARVSTKSKKQVRFQKTEVENVFISMKKYASRLFRKRSDIEKAAGGSDTSAISDSTTMSSTGTALDTATNETLPLGVFMEALLRCALIKFGHGTPAREDHFDVPAETVDTATVAIPDEAGGGGEQRHHNHHHHHHHRRRHHHHHNHHHHHHDNVAVMMAGMTVDAANGKEGFMDEKHMDEGECMTTDAALRHMLDDYLFAHATTSHSTAFRRLFLYFPEVEDMYVRFFDTISESYLHLCHTSGEINSKESALNKIGASVDGFVDMLAKANVYAKTSMRTRKLYLLVAQSKQAWDWEGMQKTLAGIPDDYESVPLVAEKERDSITQYKRISFAEYVELLGRVALQLVHDRSISSGRLSQGKLSPSKRDTNTADESGQSKVENLQASRKTASKIASWHASLDISRDDFLAELPRLFDRLKTMLLETNLSLQATTGGTMKALLKRSVAASKASRRASMASVTKTARKKLEKGSQQDQEKDNDAALRKLRTLQVLKAHEKM